MKNLTRRQMLAVGTGAVGASMLGATIGATSAEAAEPQVPKKRLGKTGVDVPILAMGMAMKFHPRFDPRLAEAARLGVTYFDTGYVYAGGTVESAVGSFHTRARNRKALFLSGKTERHDRVEKDLQDGLRKARTDHFDLYMLHGLGDPKTLSADMAKLVERLKKEGKIKHFGFSCHDGNVPELLQLAAKTPWVEVVQFRYNFRQYGDKKLNAAIDAAAKANVGLVAMKTQGSEASFTDAWKKYEKTGKWNKFQAVMKAVWADERITSIVSHMDTFEKLKSNAKAAMSRGEMGAADWDSLQRYAKATRHLACDGCDHHCSAALDRSVPIGTAMRFLMYHDAYGETAKAQELFASLDREVIRGADFSACQAACPHGVDVAQHMDRAKRLFIV
ncbi:MAG: aldo/keto reductase [Deltaproteobacteria bacterium]